MTIPDSLMIFAAGRGTRMRHLTENMPKPMITVAGKTLIDHALDLTKPLSLRRTVANLHYRPNDIREHLKDTDLLFSDETESLLETGGGLRHALPLLGKDPVFTLNTDAVWLGENPMLALGRAWEPDRMDGLLALVKKENAVGHLGAGDFLISSDGRLRRGHGPIYTGAQIIKTDRLNTISQDCFSLNLLWDKMIANKRLFGIVVDTKWCDVGQPESLELAETMLRDAHVF